MLHSWRSSIEENIKNIQPFNARPVSSVDSATQSLITSSNEISDEPVSALFCAPDFDVKFQSSDGILFQIHKINLEVNAGGFVPPEFETNNEIAHLTETATTLELLFQFCYPDHRPDVEALEFDALALLVEAAEKYQVFPAMNVCKICMRKQLPEHATDILAYAARHDYPDILDLAAPLVVEEETLSETLPKLPLDTMLRWVKYYEAVHPRPSRSKSKYKEKKVILPFSTF